MTGLVVIVAGLALAGTAWRWAIRGVEGPERLSVAVVLGLMATAFNIVVPVPNIEATTLVVVCLAVALGPSAAVVAAIVAVLGTGMTGGVGVWTAWQVVGYVTIALVASALVRARVNLDGRWMIVATVMVGTIVYDVMLTVTGVWTLGLADPEGGAASVLDALLLGAPFTLTHVAGNALIAVLGAPALVHALSRARQRMPLPMRG